MKYHYSQGAIRAFRWAGANDVRAHRPPKGWEATATLTDSHPITGMPLPRPQWWIIETKI